MKAVNIAHIGKFSPLDPWFSQNLLNYMSAEIRKSGFYYSLTLIFSWHVVAGPPDKPKAQIRAESFGNVLNLCSIAERSVILN